MRSSIMAQPLGRVWLKSAARRAWAVQLKADAQLFALRPAAIGDVTLVPEIRKPFDVLAEGLVLNNSRGDRI